MRSEGWKEYVKSEKEKYKKIGYVECQAFGNERVYFNNYGFDHLVYKGRIPRPNSEVIKRFHLLSDVYSVLKKLKSVDQEEKRIKGESCAYFWTVRGSVNNRKIRIILRRLGNSTIHFFSVMLE